MTYTLSFALPKGFGPRAGRILADRIESILLVPSVFTREAFFSEGSKAKIIHYERRAADQSAAPFCFWSRCSILERPPVPVWNYVLLNLQ
jgi:hypothetical protein